MKFYRQIKQALFQKKKPEYKEPEKIKVYVENCGWGFLEDFNAKGKGYIRFESGGGQIVRNWDHFLNMVEVIETQEEKEE